MTRQKAEVTAISERSNYLLPPSVKDLLREVAQITEATSESEALKYAVRVGAAILKQEKEVTDRGGKLRIVEVGPDGKETPTLFISSMALALHSPVKTERASLER